MLIQKKQELWSRTFEISFDMWGRNSKKVEKCELKNQYGYQNKR